MAPPADPTPSAVCGACGAAGHPGHRYCAACGSPLGVPGTCLRCHGALVPDGRFCGWCGEPVAADVRTGAAEAAAAPHARPVAERRLVSILFADLVGFTTFSEGRDAEEVRETLSRYFEIGREIIGRYGGTVEKFIGDAVMAVWGAPIAREDDAERAVRAALDLIAAIPDLGPGISARAGVLTGEAAVTIGAVGEGMVAGDLVNTAARIRELLTGLVPGIPGEALDLVARRADGMPLYAVETVRKLVADGRI
ncbi:MAG: adenylate/guanylate cyclase domain-containing protein, partial [Chloroflexota bacterium]